MINLTLKVLVIALINISFTELSFGQNSCREEYFKPDTLNFENKGFNFKTDLSDSTIKKKLDKIAKQVIQNPNCDFTILVSNKGNRKQKQSTWERGYNIIMYLIDNYGIKNTQLIFWGDDNLSRKFVVVRLPNKEESSGPNCGVPLMPKLLKK